jgi:hypothetical protein
MAGALRALSGPAVGAWEATSERPWDRQAREATPLGLLGSIYGKVVSSNPEASV